MSDEGRMKEVIEAFEKLIPAELHLPIYKVLSAILRAGNLKVK